MLRSVFAVSAVFCISAALHAGPPEAVDPAQIPAYRLLRPGLATAGQPAPDALKQLPAMGFKTVVNLRTDKEGAIEEGETVRAQGLRYVWVPITPDTFSLQDVEAVRQVLDDPAARPVLLHCASSNRVGGVWAVIQARKGRTLEDAEAEGRTAGLQSPAMAAAVRRVLGAPPLPALPPAAPAAATPVKP